MRDGLEHKFFNLIKISSTNIDLRVVSSWPFEMYLNDPDQ